MRTKLLKSLTIAYAVLTTVLAFVPDSLILLVTPIHIANNNDISLVLTKLTAYFIILFLACIISIIYAKVKNKVFLKGNGYVVEVVYKDIFETKDCKKVIGFDECFSTDVGEKPENIKPSSVCGQYLIKNKLGKNDIKRLLREADIKKPAEKSKFHNKDSYKQGTIVPNGDYLLAAFAKLDDNGLADITRKEYIDCLNILWEEIDKYHGDRSVAIPILGSGITRFGELRLSQQELLDIMLATYKMSRSQLKKPNKLIICCKKRDDFSLNKIGTII